MKKKLLFLMVILLITACLCACGGGGIRGTYYASTSSNSYVLEIKRGEKFKVVQIPSGLTQAEAEAEKDANVREGTYSLSDNQITFSFFMDEAYGAVEYTVNGTVLEDGGIKVKFFERGGSLTYKKK